MGNKNSYNMGSPVIIPATAKHTATVIFLHGLGDTGHGWAQAFQTIRAAHIKYVCPTAPTIPVTLNGGMRMPSWFDIYTLGEGREDEDGIKKATKLVNDYISEEEKHVPVNRIMLGGFSQGGALALYTCLTGSKCYAGLIALSSWLPLHKSFTNKSSGGVSAAGSSSVAECGSVGVSAVPIFQGHGDQDPLVSHKWGELTSRYLTADVGCTRHRFTTYRGMGHSSCDQELNDVKDFINEHLPNN